MTTKPATDAAPTPTPAPPAPPAVESGPRKTYVEVMRQFSGYAQGQVVDATSWKHTASLTESRYVTPADKDLVATSVPCPKCRKRWVDQATFTAHDCADDSEG